MPFIVAISVSACSPRAAGYIVGWQWRLFSRRFSRTGLDVLRTILCASSKLFLKSIVFEAGGFMELVVCQRDFLHILLISCVFENAKDLNIYLIFHT